MSAERCSRNRPCSGIVYVYSQAEDTARNSRRARTSQLDPLVGFLVLVTLRRDEPQRGERVSIAIRLEVVPTAGGSEYRGMDSRRSNAVISDYRVGDGCEQRESMSDPLLDHRPQSGSGPCAKMTRAFCGRS